MNCLSKEFQETVDLKLPQQNQASRDKEKPKIQKVLAIMRSKTDSDSDSEKYFEPRWMSIGPIHHGYPKYQLAEKYKLELAAKFIHEGNYTSWKPLYDKTRAELEALKDCFDSEIADKWNADRLSLILFFDGCAVLQFIISCNEGSLDDLNLKMNNNLVAFTRHDLFLLENQIPFGVLDILIKTRPDQDRKKLREAIVTFISSNTMAPKEKYREKTKAGLVDFKPAHLLDLLLSAILGTQVSKPGKPASQRSTEDSTPGKPASQRSTVRQTFHSIMDLKASRIYLKPSKTSSFRDISFTSLGFTGTLRLPPIVVDDITGSKFMNLIAYEMCPDNTESEHEVTSYLGFLNSLINYPADVKELRSAKILYNFIGSDKQLAALFNNFSTVSDPNQKVYKGLIQKIERHYNRGWLNKGCFKLISLIGMCVCGGSECIGKCCTCTMLLL